MLPSIRGMPCFAAEARSFSFRAALGRVMFPVKPLGVEQLGLLGIAASRTDADDIFHAVEVEQLVGVDADGGHTHTAAHHADGAAFVGAGKAQHPAHASHLPDILQKGVGNKFGTQGVTRHKDCLGEIAHFCADVRGRHR